MNMAAANRKLPRLGIPYMDTKQNVIDASPLARPTNQVTGSANFRLGWPKRLAALVLDGHRATTWWAASDGMLTEVGKRIVMLDRAGKPRAVIETMELVQRRFDEVEELFAYDEVKATEHWPAGTTRILHPQGAIRREYAAVMRALSRSRGYSRVMRM
jgi:ASCH domain-containing protein